MHRDDMGMIQLCHQAGFTLKTGSEIRVIVQIRVQHLECHIAIQPGMVCLINCGHSTLTQLFDNSIGTYIFTRCKRHSCTPKTSYAQNMVISCFQYSTLVNSQRCYFRALSL